MAGILDCFEQVLDKVMTFLIALVALSIASFVILIPLNLVFIKLKISAIWWLTEGIEYALYVGVFLGAPWVLKQGAHVRIDIFATLLPPKAAKVLQLFTELLGAAICVTLVFYGSRATIWEYVDGTFPNKDLRIANWYMMLIFSFSFTLMAFEFLFRFRRRLKAPADSDPENPMEKLA